MSAPYGERLSEYVEHYHAERNHQGKSNVLLFPSGHGNASRVSPCNVARGWVGSCVFTIKKLREWARQVSVDTRKLAESCTCAKANAC